MERQAEELLMPNAKSKSDVTNVEAMDMVAEGMVVADLVVVDAVAMVVVGANWPPEHAEHAE